MGRTKKKLPVPPAAKEVSGSTAAAAENPPTQKKRGRPRKVVQEAVKAEEYDTTEAKKPKTTGDAGSRQNKPVESSPTGSDKNDEANKGSSDDEPPKPKPVKREGSRRKSEPRRAAESSLVGR